MKRLFGNKTFGIVAAGIVLAAPSISWAQGASDIQTNLNTVWIVLSASLVFLMQAGFTALETGFIRAKNSINVAMKNFGDFAFGSIAFWFIGFGLMFGVTNGGWVGTSGFTLEGYDDPWSYAFFIFQVVFCATAATIVSGAVAERMQYRAYLVISIALSALIYPISGHWVWGNGLIADQAGWLEQQGFVDFAGSTVVHSVGAWVGLAGAWFLGPRIGRFDNQGIPQEMPGHNTALATVGVLILWFGWFGFNGGSTLVGDGSIAKVIVNTNLAAAAGAIIGFLLSLFFEGRPVVEKLLNGALGGLVAITAGCALVDPLGAVAIGAIAGVVMYTSDWLLTWVCRIDDPLGAVPVHGFCGAWGTLGLALFAPIEALPAGGHLTQLGVQAMGVLAVFGWAFGCGVLIFGILNWMKMLRVTPEDESRGLNVSEHGAKMAWLDAMTTMRDIVQDGDLSRRVDVEIGTEAGEVAATFNILLSELEEKATIAETIARGDLSQVVVPKSHRDKLGHAMANMVGNLRNVVGQVREAVGAITESAGDLGQSSQEMAGVSQELSASVAQAVVNATQTTQAAEEMNDEASRGIQAAMVTVSGLQGTHEAMKDLQGVVNGLDVSSNEIGGIVKTINEIADQTNLLSLNAAIEAARSGEAGRGFSVVADEVRKLSDGTSKATQEIKKLIAAVQQDAGKAVTTTNEEATAIEAGAEMAMQSGQALDKIREAVSQVLTMVHELQGSIKSQSQASSWCASAADQVAQISQNLVSQSRKLKETVSFFRETTSEKDTVHAQFKNSLEESKGTLVLV